MSSLVYNGIPIIFARITTAAEVQYDQKSNQQLRQVKHTVTCSGEISPAILPAELGETNAGQVLARIRSALTSPRKQLQVFIGDFLYLNSPAAGNAVDVANGPFPRHVDVQQITGSNLITVNIVIETSLYECYDGSPGTPGTDAFLPAWTTHTFSEQMSIDENWFTTRRRTGMLTVRADANLSPDNFRDVVIPPIPRGFRRVSSDYTIQEDGLAMSYTYVDKEVYKEPPAGITRFEGERMSESDEKGCIFKQTIRVKLWGNKQTSKAKLLAVAGFLIFNQFNALPNTANSIMGSQVRDNFGGDDNWLEMTVTQGLVVQNATFYGVAGNFFNLDLDHYPGEDLTQTPSDPGTRGTALLEAVAPVLSDPCLNATLQAQSGGAQLQAGFDGTPASITTVPVVPNMTSALATFDVSTGLHTDYKIATTIYADQHTVQLAKAGASVSAFVQLAPPTFQKVVQWTATKWSQPPTCPNPNLIDPNAVQLHTSAIVHAPQVAPNGKTPIYTAEGVYIYGMADPTQVDMAAGAIPYIQTTYSNTRYSMWSNGIIDNGTQTATLQTGGFAASPPAVNPLLGGSSLSTG